MENTFNKVWQWLVTSSADPRKTSLFVRGALLAFTTQAVVWIAQGFDIICTFGYACYYFDPGIMDDVRVFIDSAAEVVYLVLMLIASVQTGYGAIRKVWITMTKMMGV